MTLPSTMTETTNWLINRNIICTQRVTKKKASATLTIYKIEIKSIVLSIINHSYCGPCFFSFEIQICGGYFLKFQEGFRAFPCSHLLVIREEAGCSLLGCVQEERALKPIFGDEHLQGVLSDKQNVALLILNTLLEEQLQPRP